MRDGSTARQEQICFRAMPLARWDASRGAQLAAFPFPQQGSGNSKPQRRGKPNLLGSGGGPGAPQPLTGGATTSLLLTRSGHRAQQRPLGTGN